MGLLLARIEVANVVVGVRWMARRCRAGEAVPSRSRCNRRVLNMVIALSSTDMDHGEGGSRGPRGTSGVLPMHSCPHAFLPHMNSAHMCVSAPRLPVMRWYAFTMLSSPTSVGSTSACGTPETPCHGPHCQHALALPAAHRGHPLRPIRCYSAVERARFGI